MRAQLTATTEAELIVSRYDPAYYTREDFLLACKEEANRRASRVTLRYIARIAGHTYDADWTSGTKTPDKVYG